MLSVQLKASTEFGRTVNDEDWRLHLKVTNTSLAGGALRSQSSEFWKWSGCNFSLIFLWFHFSNIYCVVEADMLAFRCGPTSHPITSFVSSILNTSKSDKYAQFEHGRALSSWSFLLFHQSIIPSWWHITKALNWDYFVIPDDSRINRSEDIFTFLFKRKKGIYNPITAQLYLETSLHSHCPNRCCNLQPSKNENNTVINLRQVMLSSILSPRDMRRHERTYWCSDWSPVWDTGRFPHAVFSGLWGVCTVCGEKRISS